MWCCTLKKKHKNAVNTIFLNINFNNTENYRGPK